MKQNNQKQDRQVQLLIKIPGLKPIDSDMTRNPHMKNYARRLIISTN